MTTKETYKAINANQFYPAPSALFHAGTNADIRSTPPWKGTGNLTMVNWK